MKKLLILIVLFFAFSSVKAQGIPLEYGARLALQMAKYSHAEGTEASFKFGFALGMYAAYNLQQQMALVGELLYNRRASGWEGSDGYGTWTSDVVLQFITLNLMFKYYVMPTLALMGGPQLNFLLSANEDWEYKDNGNTQTGSEDIKEHLKSMEFGLVLGLAYQLQMGLIVDVRYFIGLNNIADRDQDDTKGQAIIVGFSYPLSK